MIVYKAYTVLRYVIKSVLVLYFMCLCVCVFVELVTMRLCVGEDSGFSGGKSALTVLPAGGNWTRWEL